MRKPDPVELVAIAVPVLCEVIAVLLFFGCCFVWISISATRHKAPDLGIVHLVGERQ